MTDGGSGNSGEPKRSCYDIAMLVLAIIATIAGVAALVVAIVEPVIFCRLWNVGCPPSQSANPTPTPDTPSPQPSPTPTETAPSPENVPDACHPNPDSESQRDRLIGAWQWSSEDPWERVNESYIQFREDGAFLVYDKRRMKTFIGGNWSYDNQNNVFKLWTGDVHAVTHRVNWKDPNHFEAIPVAEKSLQPFGQAERNFSRTQCLEPN